MAEAVVDLLALRKPFPPELIGKLPRGRTELDYVGHADVTSRLLEVDLAWNWEPLAKDENGLPLFDLDKNGNPVGFWIKLTIGGVTRLGYGSCPSTQSDAVKVLIGDGLRNAAMRFGVALDLWAKGDRADPTAENPSGSAGQAARRTRTTVSPARPASAQDLVVRITRAQTRDDLNVIWKQAGAAGMLLSVVTVTETGEKVTIQDLLYRRADSISFPKSAGAPGEDAGEGDGDQG